MSEHAWILENLATYLAGGLTFEERERVERHTADCRACAGALDEIRSVDGQLEALFVGVRPGPAMEDRFIQALRQTPVRRRRLRFGRSIKVGLAVAAALLLAVVGAGMSTLEQKGTLPFPQSLAQFLGMEGMQVSVLDSTDSTNGRLPKERAFATSSRDFVTSDGTTQLEARAGGVSLWDEVSGKVKDQAASNSLGFYPPSLAVVVKGSSTVHTKVTGGSLGRTNSSPQLGYFKPSDVFSRQLGRDAGKTPLNAWMDAEAKQLGDLQQKTGLQIEEGKPAARGNQQKQPPSTAAEPGSRKIIRSGEIEFEVDSFDAAVAVVTRLIAAAQGGFIATVNSEKLPNGKVRGSVVVRLPPDKLDAFVLDLRKELGKAGDLKGQRIGSKDISKEYTDLDSRLRAARTMEERLLKIIKEGKGQMKDLLLAEKELGEWRTRVEQMEGELRFYANQVSLSTLTVNLTEKEIRQAAVVTENERVQTGIQVDDVEKAFRAALDAVAEAKGRVTRSDLKQQSAGQFNAVLHFEAAAEAAGPLRDRLRQLGTVVRLDIDRVQQAEGGVAGLRDGKVKRGPTQFVVSLYNVINVTPRETVVLEVAAADVPAAYRKLRTAVDQAEGRVHDAQLNEQDHQTAAAQLDFDLRRAKEGALQAALAEAGEALSRQVTRRPAGEDVTDAMVLFKVKLVSAQGIAPRETRALVVEVADVEAAQAVIAAQVREAGGRVGGPQLKQETSGRVTALITYDVPLAAAPGLVEKIKAAGRVRKQDTTKNDQAPEGKLALARLEVAWTNGELLVPGDAGLWAQVRNGLSFSLRGLALSVSWLVIGVLVVLPWVLVVYVLVLAARRLWRRGTPPSPTTPS